MRIAVSGTHCSGKSTLIEDFVAAHPDYVHELEPYEWLVELYGESISAEPDVQDFYRQLEVSVERLCGYPRGSRVIAERSPVDFVAYIRALADLRGEETSDLVERAWKLVQIGMRHVDLLVVLPLEGIAAPEDEDPELREAMNEQLLELIQGDELRQIAPDEMRIIEARGSDEQRLAMLEHAITG